MTDEAGRADRRRDVLLLVQPSRKADLVVEQLLPAYGWPGVSRPTSKPTNRGNPGDTWSTTRACNYVRKSTCVQSARGERAPPKNAFENKSE